MFTLKILRIKIKQPSLSGNQGDFFLCVKLNLNSIPVVYISCPPNTHLIWHRSIIFCLWLCKLCEIQVKLKSMKSCSRPSSRAAGSLEQKKKKPGNVSNILHSECLPCLRGLFKFHALCTPLR